METIDLFLFCVVCQIEKIIFEQIDKYLASHNLLYEFQSGFQKSHSTDTCLLYLTDHIRREVDKGPLIPLTMVFWYAN